jgi:hypothetical protein
MDNTKKTNRTVAEEVSEAQKYWKKNYLWTALLFVGIFLWSFLKGPGLSVVPGADELTVTAHDGQVVSVAYSTITAAELLEEPQYGTMISGAEQKDGKTGTWEHPQWGSYTLCAYASSSLCVRIETDHGSYVLNLPSEDETRQLFRLIQDRIPASR